MNLSYHGISYQPSFPAVETTETEHTGRFLGNSYKVMQGKVARRQATIQLNYRGIAYNA